MYSNQMGHFPCVSCFQPWQYQHQFVVDRGPQKQHWQKTYTQTCMGPRMHAKSGHGPQASNFGQSSVRSL
jgi:hypothetical protein